MLNGLKISKVDAVVRAAEPDLGVEDVREVALDSCGVWLTLKGVDDPYLAMLRGEPGSEAFEKFRSLMRSLWGGPLEDVMEIEIFQRGYAVTTKTSVGRADLDGKWTLAVETRVGPLVDDSKEEL